MYNKYHTEGIVLGGTHIGEANIYLTIFTRDLGLVRASAQGLREVKSKLRYSLQDLSHAKVELVFGRGGWRVVSAEEVRSYATLFLQKNELTPLGVCVRLSQLLRRLIHGEAKNAALFEDVVGLFSFLSSRTLHGEEFLQTEMVGVMRILYHLGYWGGNDALSPFLRGQISENLIRVEVKKIKSLALREINKSLEATQL